VKKAGALVIWLGYIEQRHAKQGGPIKHSRGCARIWCRRRRNKETKWDSDLTFQKVGCQPAAPPEEAAMAASDSLFTMLRYRTGTARFSKRMIASSTTHRQALNCNMGVLGHTYTIAVHMSSYLHRQ